YMIKKDTHERYGEELEFISIDLSDKKHPNRVIDFLEIRDPVSKEFTCDIHAKWSEGKYHPTLKMSEEDFLDLADLFGAWAERIRKAKKD
ncbi:hypothetical protein, partial [Pseudomonas syringae]